MRGECPTMRPSPGTYISDYGRTSANAFGEKVEWITVSILQQMVFAEKEIAHEHGSSRALFK